MLVTKKEKKNLFPKLGYMWNGKEKGRKKLPNMMYNTTRTLNSPILQTLAFSPEKLTKVKFSILVSKAFVLSMVKWLTPFIQRTNDPMVGFLSDGDIFHLMQGKGFPSFPLVAFSVALRLITHQPLVPLAGSLSGFCASSSFSKIRFRKWGFTPGSIDLLNASSLRFLFIPKIKEKVR